jgi:FkbM family methyltransferase
MMNLARTAHCAAANLRAEFAIRSERAQGDWDVINEVYVHDTYKIAEITVEPRIVLDIGAHIGSFTVLLKQRFPNAIVHCYEPHPRSFELLCQNTADLANVRCFNEAIGYLDGDIVLTDTPLATGGGFLLRRGTLDELPEGGVRINGHEYTFIDAPITITSVETALLRLGDISTGQEYPHVDLAKWDCEGGEIDSFRHMSKEAARAFGRLVGEYHCPTQYAGFEFLARACFPKHTFESRDGHLDIGWFRALPEGGSW